MCIAALAIATPAHGATLARSGSTLTYQAASGETNKPRIGVFNGSISFRDDSATITPGAGCGTDEFGNVLCPATGITSVTVSLGDGNDELEGFRGEVILPAAVDLRVDGGVGDDELVGTRRDDVLIGGSGDDRVSGGGGRDTLEGGAGNDRIAGYGTLRGGAGNDFIEIFTGVVPGPVFASRVFAGSGNDRVLSGNERRDVIDCGAGRDSATSGLDRPGFDQIARNCETRTGRRNQ